MPKVGEKEVGRKIIHKMERNTKVLILTGPSNCGKTITLGKVSEYLQQEKGYTCLSHKVFGGKMNDIFDLLQNKDGKLVVILSEGDYERDMRWNEMFVYFSMCDVFICACSDKFKEKFTRFLLQSKVYEKQVIRNTTVYEETNKEDALKIVNLMMEIL